MSERALLIIDIQNDYFPGGGMELEGADAAAANASKALGRARQHGTPVIHVRHLSTRPGSTFFLPGTKGAEIHETVRPLANERVIEKNFPNSFRGTALEQNAEYYVRVRANASPRSTGFVWPWQGDDAMGFAKFTFIR
jgi:nicotinamidase-related amidase